MAVNIYDIAREANTSISTVSRFLNNKNVRPDTKKRIEAVIAKYGFKPNAIAKGLVTKSMKTIAVMIVDIRLPHYSDAAFFIDKELSPYGYRVVVCNTSGDISQSIKYIDSVLELNVDGIIFIGSIFNELNRYPDILAKIRNIPVVLTNGRLAIDRCGAVYVDDQDGIYDATKYLIDKGRTKIKYIQYSSNSSASNKATGYVRAMKEAGLPPQIYFTNDIFGGYEQTEKILFDSRDVDGIISGEDLISIGVIRALNKEGFKVGTDVDVIGFNASEYGELCSPSLTSIDNKIEQSSKIAAQMLCEMIEKNKEARVEEIRTELVIKESA